MTKKKRATSRPVAGIYHVVRSHEGFEETAQSLFKLVKKSQQVKPGAPRLLFLDIEGHRNAAGGFDVGMTEFQLDFCVGFLGPFLSEVYTPLLNVKFTAVQRDDLPDTLCILED